MPEPPESFDELINALREHPEWRRNLREVLAEEPEPVPEPPARSRWKPRLATLGMGVLAGALVAAVAAFVLLRDEGDGTAASPPGDAPADGRGGQSLPEALASPTATPEPSATPTPAPPTPTPTATPEPSSPTATETAPPATPTPTPRGSLSAPGTATATAPVATPAPAGPPRYTFAGFNGACAPVEAVVNVENITRRITISGRWVQDGGATVIDVAPLPIDPAPPGSVVTVRFPTVAPLTPGQYTFTAFADGVVVATASTPITC